MVKLQVPRHKAGHNMPLPLLRYNCMEQALSELSLTSFLPGTYPPDPPGAKFRISVIEKLTHYQSEERLQWKNSFFVLAGSQLLQESV